MAQLKFKVTLYNVCEVTNREAWINELAEVDGLHLLKETKDYMLRNNPAGVIKLKNNNKKSNLITNFIYSNTTGCFILK